MATSLFAALFRRSPSAATAPPPTFPYNIRTNPYRCQRPWPPDFTQLSPKHQFRLERRYRRRTQLKWARPRWTKAITLTQWGCILFVCVYGVMYLDLNQEGRTMYDGMKKLARREQQPMGEAEDRSGEQKAEKRV